MSEAERPSSRELRARYERDYALPLARALFELEPRCQSVLFTVGQYWCDEANDAVHEQVWICAEREPSWPELAKPGPTTLGDEATLRELVEEASDEPQDISDAQWELQRRASQLAFGTDVYSGLDDNGDMIVAFASYCREEGSQEEPLYVSHVPYGVVRRPPEGDAPSLELVGQMYRPEWEDRWDVLEWGEGGGVLPPPEAPKLPAPAAKPPPTYVAPRTAADAAPLEGSRRRLASPLLVLLLFVAVSVLLSLRACFKG